MQATINPDDGPAAEPVPPWLELPDPCLLVVLHCCAAIHPRSLFSAARAHSRLWQAAALVLDSIDAKVGQQERMESLLLYLSKHGQHVRSISLEGVDAPYKLQFYPAMTLCKLPATMPGLRSVSFRGLRLQLQPGRGCRGVLPAQWSGAVAADLTRLEFQECMLFDGSEGLKAALEQLPGLEHLSIFSVNRKRRTIRLPGDVLLGLPHLTALQAPVAPQSQAAGALQHLTALTRLADLRLLFMGTATVTADMLAQHVQHLTRLQLQSYAAYPLPRGDVCIEPALLAGMTRLQHLELRCYLVPGGSAGTAELLYQLQHLQQLTALFIRDSLQGWQASTEPTASPPAAAYAALTASSKLRVLGISCCRLPAGVWQHVFPAGRQLPHLRALDVRGTLCPPGTSVPDCSRLVSCCPGLQTLALSDLPREADIAALAQLTGLRELRLDGSYGWSACDMQMLPLTRLTQLTRLENEIWPVDRHPCTLYSQAPCDQPVWRQLLRRLLRSSDPEVAHKAAAGLALGQRAT